MMGKSLMKVSLFVLLVITSLSCSDKRGIDKVKEGVSEISDDVEKESKENKLEIKFGK